MMRRSRLQLHAGVGERRVFRPAGTGESAPVGPSYHEVRDVVGLAPAIENFAQGGVVLAEQGNRHGGFVGEFGGNQAPLGLFEQVVIDQAQAVAEQQGDDEDEYRQAGDDQPQAQAAAGTGNAHGRSLIMSTVSSTKGLRLCRSVAETSL